MRWAAALSVLCLVACAESPGEPPTGRASPGIPAEVSCQWANVVHISDGDTVRVDLDGGKRNVPVRYIGMDTPEVGAGDSLAAAATVRNGQLAADQRICLERDVSETDRYGRLLRDAWLPDGRLVNEVLVREGLAVLLTIPPDVKYADRLAAAQAAARSDEMGIWNR
jgi:micrococcal nuclease